MTLSFSSEIYANLLAKYQPKAIKTDEENEEAIAIVEELAHRYALRARKRPNRTLEETTLFELLLALIEKYEGEQYPIPKSNSHAMLLHLMEARSLQPSDIIQILGSSSVAAEIIDDRREIDRGQAEVLGKFFHVDPSLFI
ncbi:MAG: transcriptional regulator [Cyanosarcina radialis HA8281-LM2]|jgi:HTH-type transcriptional regulator/antitoxin HigA|nr:transcriptional regulator [Cyanosarcina radialis HA8281-LM2]